EASVHYVGWDWASRSHDVTVLDDRGQVLDRWGFPHTEPGWTKTLQRLGSRSPAADLPVIIERTSGLVIDRLLAAGHPVVPVHPRAPPASAAADGPRSSRAASTGAPARGSGPGSHHQCQPVPRNAGCLLARAATPVPVAGIRHRAGVLDRLPDTTVGSSTRG